MGDAVVAGFVASLGLIVAIGAQNAFVLRQGLARAHVAMVVVLCAASDAALIAAGVGGVGAVVRRSPGALRVLLLVGSAYLAAYGVRSLWRARRPAGLDAGGRPEASRRAVVGATLAFTFLNPHVYLDTVVLLGTIGNRYGGDRWWFVLGAAAASATWFSALGLGAHAAAPLLARPRTWRVVDAAIGVVMLTLAAVLVRTDVAGLAAAAP